MVSATESRISLLTQETLPMHRLLHRMDVVVVIVAHAAVVTVVLAETTRSNSSKDYKSIKAGSGYGIGFIG